MAKTLDSGRPKFFERLKRALGQSIAYSRGELALYTTSLPLPAPRMARTRIIRIRRMLRMSRFLFAATLNVSMDRVVGWERGDRQPNRAERRLSQIIESRPGVIGEVLGQVCSRKLRKCGNDVRRLAVGRSTGSRGR